MAWTCLKESPAKNYIIKNEPKVNSGSFFDVKMSRLGRDIGVGGV